MEFRLKLRPIVRLQNMNAKRKSLSNLVKEPDSGALVARIINLQYADTRAIVDNSELIESFSRPGNTFQKLHVHLQAVARLGFLVPFPPFSMRLVFLIGRQPSHFVLHQDPMYSRAGNLHLVEAM
jgi:hypothetical protein